LEETPEHLARRLHKEQQAGLREREVDLSGSLAPFRVGSVPYLNAAPLTRGLDDQILFATPAQLAERLHKGKLDAALVSVTEVLFHEGYDILDGVAVASLGEVKSVLLAHRAPLEEARVVHCDPASLTSVNLLRVLLAERGVRPEFKSLASYDFGSLPDYTLLIGDTALDFTHTPHERQVWDLGSAWHELTRLPFVYAVWALRRDVDSARLRQLLTEAKDFGMDTLDYLITSRTEYTPEFRRDYLGWHIHYHLGADEKKGLAKFIELLRQHGTDRIFEPRFVR
jgi:chorismate dehydratase